MVGALGAQSLPRGTLLVITHRTDFTTFLETGSRHVTEGIRSQRRLQGENTCNFRGRICTDYRLSSNIFILRNWDLIELTKYYHNTRIDFKISHHDFCDVLKTSDIWKYFKQWHFVACCSFDLCCILINLMLSQLRIQPQNQPPLFSATLLLQILEEPSEGLVFVIHSLFCYTA